MNIDIGTLRDLLVFTAFSAIFPAHILPMSIESFDGQYSFESELWIALNGYLFSSVPRSCSCVVPEYSHEENPIWKVVDKSLLTSSCHFSEKRNWILYLHPLTYCQTGLSSDGRDAFA